MTRKGVCVLYDLSCWSCLNVKRDLGMRRGDVTESGEEARKAVGEDISPGKDARALWRSFKRAEGVCRRVLRVLDVFWVNRGVDARLLGSQSRPPEIPCMRVIHLSDCASRL